MKNFKQYLLIDDNELNRFTAKIGRQKFMKFLDRLALIFKHMNPGDKIYIDRFVEARHIPLVVKATCAYIAIVGDVFFSNNYTEINKSNVKAKENEIETVDEGTEDVRPGEHRQIDAGATGRAAG